MDTEVVTSKTCGDNQPTMSKQRPYSKTSYKNERKLGRRSRISHHLPKLKHFILFNENMFVIA